MLSTVPVNLRQSAPFLSIGRDDLSASDEANLTALRERASAGAERSLAGGARSVATGNRPDAGHADSHFQLATSLENLGEFALARSHYERALDLDGLASERIHASMRLSSEWRASTTQVT